MWSTFDIFFPFFVESRLTDCLKRNFQQHWNLRHVNFSLWGFKPGSPAVHCAGVSSSAGGGGGGGGGERSMAQGPFGRSRAPSFLPHPNPALLLEPFFARSLTLVPRYLFLHRTETLSTQAIPKGSIDTTSSPGRFSRPQSQGKAPWGRGCNRHEVLILGH